MNTLLRTLALSLGLCLSLPAQETKPDEAPAAVQLPVVDPANVDDLRAHEQQDVIVRGKVQKTKDWDGKGQPGKGLNFVDFEGGHFQIITFASDYENFKAGRPAAIYRGKNLEVTGKLETRNGNWQIKVSKPEQVKVIEASGKEEKDSQKKDAKRDDKKAAKKDPSKHDKDKADPND